VEIKRNKAVAAKNLRSRSFQASRSAVLKKQRNAMVRKKSIPVVVMRSKKSLLGIFLFLAVIFWSIVNVNSVLFVSKKRNWENYWLINHIVHYFKAIP